MNYRIYRLSKREELLCIGGAILCSVAAAYLLYKSFWGVFLFAVIYPEYKKRYQRQRLAQRKKELTMHFSDAMQGMMAALLSGFSVENAWKEAERELEGLYGKEDFIVKELKQMNRGVSVNVPVEKLLYDFALRSGCEDILEFAEVFLFAKRSGGNFTKIMKNTVSRIREKNSVEQEIATALAGKKMEQKVMNIVPVLLLAYLNITSSEFLAPLYGSALGVGVMTLAFLGYLGALYLSEKMMNIEI